MSGLFADFDEDDLDAVADAMMEPDAPAKPQAEELTPRTMPDLYGHEAAEAQLLADFNAGRMPHAIILAGPAGIGKATMAFRLARFFISQKEEAGGGLFGPADDPTTFALPPDNDVFRRVASGGHGDLLVVQREINQKTGKLKEDIAVDDARKIPAFMSKTAAEGGWRVVVVDGGEDLNKNSQNALLKILEEPPSRALLILTTTQVQAMLPTTRSRCRIVNLSPLSDANMEKLMARLMPGLPAEEKKILLRVANGSIGAARAFHEAGGIALYKSLLGIAQDLPRLDMVAVHAFADKHGRGASEDVFTIIENIFTGWCDTIVRASARGMAPADILPGDGAILAQWQSAFPPLHFIEAGDALRRLFGAVNRSYLDKRQAIISAFLLLQNPDQPALGI